MIVGAGFGGLEAAHALRRADADVIVVDRHNHHTFQPLLYQVATAALAAPDIAWPVRSILRNQGNARVVMADVTGVDVQRRRVRSDTLDIPYDYLVLATGVSHSYFGHDNWAPVAPGLKTIEDAMEIRRRILLAFERAEVAADDSERKRLLTFIIVGGGPTGVEMAGAIAEVARYALRSDFRRIDPTKARIVLVEAGSRILPTFPERLSHYAGRVLARMGVEVRTSAMVTDCRKDGVSLKDGAIEANTIVWAAGVTASPAARWIGAETDRSGRIKVGADLGVPGRPEIFAVGDTAVLTGPNAPPIPGIAPAAKQMGRHVGKVIAARIAGGEAPAPFVYRHYLDLAAIGRSSAVVRRGRLQLTGYLAWWFWGIAHIYFLIGVRNRFIVAVNWFWNYLTFQRGARVITERST
ncbi:MAG TPA: NAD(P)/FAD-dependent oxidoreductase [Xanthobacteraceae bacterium]